jgi:hypothetical protein
VVLHFAKKRNTVLLRCVSVVRLLLSVMPLGCRELHFSFFRLLAELGQNFRREPGVYSSGGFLELVYKKIDFFLLVGSTEHVLRV